MTAADLYESPLFGVAITCLAYGLWTLAQRRWRWAHALLGTCGTVIAFLLIAKVPIASYQNGGKLVSFFLGPATVALGVPFYTQAKRIRRHLPAIGVAVLAGSITGMATAGLVAWWLHASNLVLRAMIPKSVTTPISMEVARQLGGSPELAAVFTVIAGLIGSLIGPWLLRLVGVRNEIARGAGIGTSSHGIGTARLLRDSDLAGGVSGFSMALAGVITSLLAIPLHHWLS